MPEHTPPSRRAVGPAGLFPVTIAGTVGLLVVSVVSNLLMLTGPLFMMQVYDRVLASRSVPTLVVLTLLIMGLYAFYAFLDALRMRMALRFANFLDSCIRDRLFAASIKLKLTAGIPATSDPIRDGDALRQFLGGIGPLALLDLPWLPIYLALVFLIHPMLGWLAALGGAAIVVLMVANELLSRRPSQQTTATQSRRTRQADDARLNAETIVAMGMLSDLRARWIASTDAAFSAQRWAGDRASLFSAITKSFRFLLQSGVLALGAYLVIQGELTGGVMIAASIMTSRALAPVEQIVGQWRGFIGARQAFRRIKTYLRVPDETGRDTHLPLPQRSVAVKQLATAPAGSKLPLLQAVNFQLTAGEGLGVLGLSGSGKSSLARALVGVWPCLGGEIRLDGAELSHYDPSQIGQIFGYLPQRVDLFDGTVAENISRFSKDAPSERIIEAAQLARVHDIISQLPNGYDTQVGEQGELLSAGQRQRIGLARALFGNPFLIVLDEPNSNLDAEGDVALSDAIHSARNRGAIVIVVAHRPSAISAVDKVLFLKAGRQVAFGPKNEVLEQITQQNAGDNVRAMKVTA